MIARVRVEVGDRKEANHIQTALEDPDVRAFVIIVGVLKPFSGRTRKRILGFVSDSLAEAREQEGATLAEVLA